MSNEMEGTLICIKKCTYIDYKNNVYLITPGQEVNCIITDFGIRFEYRRQHYTQLVKIRNLIEYFKLKN
ncbi:MAG: hypothetical protein ACRDDY_16995 [Clostridium sp.]|uniref:hypothetical protein n=1 Tax=Clostridium sp. TaxID=1506 RepID=UPI003EE56A55